MFKRFVVYILDLFTDPYGVGQYVYWDNPVDYRFREYYIITKKVNKDGRVRIYNDIKGFRYAYESNLIPEHATKEGLHDVLHENGCTKEKVKLIYNKRRIVHESNNKYNSRKQIPR